jgi:hypothetical protein
MHRAAHVLQMEGTSTASLILNKKGKRQEAHFGVMWVSEKKGLRKRKEVPRKWINVQNGVLHNLYCVGTYYWGGKMMTGW